MTGSKKKAKTIHVRFSERDPRDQRLWRQMGADKEDEAVILSALIKGLLAAYYDYRELTGSAELPSIVDIGSGHSKLSLRPTQREVAITASDASAASFLSMDYDD